MYIYICIHKGTLLLLKEPKEKYRLHGRTTTSGFEVDVVFFAKSQSRFLTDFLVKKKEKEKKKKVPLKTTSDESLRNRPRAYVARENDKILVKNKRRMICSSKVLND